MKPQEFKALIEKQTGLQVGIILYDQYAVLTLQSPNHIPLLSIHLKEIAGDWKAAGHNVDFCLD